MASSIAAVVPRVLPIFIRELTTASTRGIREEHLNQLSANLSDVFSSRVLDDDVADLVVCLLALAKEESDAMESQKKSVAALSEDSNVLLTVVPDTLGFHILRLLLQLFDLRTLHAARCFRAVRKFSDSMSRKKAIEAEKEAKNQEAYATFGGGLTSSSEASNNNNNTFANTNNNSYANRFKNASAYSAAHNNNNSTFGAAFGGSSFGGSSVTIAKCVDDALNNPLAIGMDGLLSNDSTRRMVIRLWKEWDGSGIDVEHFTAEPQLLHLYLPQRNTNKMRVYRDFAFCTPRPKLNKQWGSVAACHIKTNIPKKSDIMYRILVEGYNYGVNAVVLSDVVGYTNRNWDTITDLEQYGWPTGWDSEMCNDYAPGVAISQYYSADGFLVVRLRAKSMFCMGFSVSGWFVFHGFGAGFPICATISHQDEDM